MNGNNDNGILTRPKSPRASSNSLNLISDFACVSMVSLHKIRSFGTVISGSSPPPVRGLSAMTLDPRSSRPGMVPILMPLKVTPWNVAHVGKEIMGLLSQPCERPSLIIVVVRGGEFLLRYSLFRLSVLGVNWRMSSTGFMTSDN